MSVDQDGSSEQDELLKDYAFAYALALQNDASGRHQLEVNDVVAIREDKYAYQFVGLDAQSGQAVLRRRAKPEMGEEGDFIEKKAPLERVASVDLLQMGLTLNQNRMPALVMNKKSKSEE